MKAPTASILSSSAWHSPVRSGLGLLRPIPVLAAGHLHEIHDQGTDRASGLGFALGMTALMRQGMVMVVRAAGRTRLDFHAEGLAMLGLDPARLLLVEARDPLAMLRAGLEGARCPGLALVLMESEGALKTYDLTASRRFVLAAERTGTPVVLLRHGAPPGASAAQTRWQVTSAPSRPLAAPPGVSVRPPGPPALVVEALRWRGGPAGQKWHLHWDDIHGGFHETTGTNSNTLGGDTSGSRPSAPSRSVLPLAALRASAPPGSRAA